jgi:hypothetical protein
MANKADGTVSMINTVTNQVIGFLASGSQFGYAVQGVAASLITGGPCGRQRQ